MSKLSFRMKLISFALIIGFVPLVILGIIAYSRSADALQESIYRGNKVYLENAIIKVNNYFSERLGDAEVISGSENVKQMLRTSGRSSRATNTEYLKTVKEAYGYSFITVTDSEGRVVASDMDKLIGADLSGRDYMQTALKGEAMWTDLFYSDLVETNVMVLTYPIMDDGKLEGVMLIVIGQEVVNDLIHSGVKSLGASGDAYLVNEDSMLYTETLLGDYTENAALTESIISEGTSMLSDAIMSGDDTYQALGMYNDYLGNPVLGALGVVKVGDKPLGMVIEVDVAEAMQPVVKLRNLIMQVSAFISAIAFSITLFLIQVILKPIKGINAMLKDISEGEGDLTKTLNVPSKDEFGEMASLFNDFNSMLRGIIGDVKSNAVSLASSATEITVTVDESSKSIESINFKASEVNENITSNASVTQETNASVEEMASSSEVMASKAQEIAMNSTQALEATEQGSMRLSSAKDSIESVEKLSGNMGIVITELNGSIERIGDIIKIITGISEQVNLLALNAAIEAARAGEHGRGFAVVAEEVRKLADESRTSAESIASLINQIIKQSSDALKSVDEEKKQVQISVQNINETDNEMRNIVHMVSSVSTNIEDIASMINSQSESTRDISRAMDQITQSSVEGASSVGDITMNIQNQSASLEEISASMEELNAMAELLQEEMSKFKV